MYYNSDEFRQNGSVEDINIDINNYNNDFNMNQFDMDSSFMQGSIQGPIIEPGKERVVQRNIIHEVKHVCPVNTKIINNHIFKHIYEPRYTCCEENVCTNVQCGSCSCFN